jgi:hypothetical protein
MHFTQSCTLVCHCLVGGVGVVESRADRGWVGLCKYSWSKYQEEDGMAVYQFLYLYFEIVQGLQAVSNLWAQNRGILKKNIQEHPPTPCMQTR